MLDHKQFGGLSSVPLRRTGAWFILAVLSSLGLVATGQDAEEAEETEETEIEEEESTSSPDPDDETIEAIIVTGSRIVRSPGDLANQLIVIDEDAIRAAGEVTLERLLRQLPQNQNPTTEKFGDRLNTGTNFSGASTVNLRGLGSESTLILVDGKRVGHNGMLGGVTDVSSIPLAMVERVEIVLDGASAVYGSDAVGGVVNIITKRDYEEIDLHLNLDWPADSGFSEFRGGIATTQTLGNIRVTGSYNRSVKSGLDAADRNEAIFKHSIFPGPQFDIWGFRTAPVFYRLNGQNITISEFNTLPVADRADAVAVARAVLPDDWNSSSDLDSITIFEGPNWGIETQRGFSVLPESVRNTFGGGIDMPITESISGTLDLQYETRMTTFNQGYVTVAGFTVHPRNPFNPFKTRIYFKGQLRDLAARPYTQTESSNLNWSGFFSGNLIEKWSFDLGFGQSTSLQDAKRYNVLDRATFGRGANSDGVTPSYRYISGLSAQECADLGGVVSFGLCRVPVPAPAPIDPFGDISRFVSEKPLVSSGENRQTRVEGSIQGQAFEIPSGPVRALIGFSSHTTVLDLDSQFQIGIVDESPVSDVDSVNTYAERSNTSFFFETSIPVVSERNVVSGVDGLILSLSMRFDSYDSPKVIYTDPEGGTKNAEGLKDLGSENTWGLGFVYTLPEFLKFRYNRQTSFVAPQLNQLLLETSGGPNAPFRTLYLILPNGDLKFADAIVTEGGNPDLLPETAESTSYGMEFRLPQAPLFVAKVTWSGIDYINRISTLSNFYINPELLPSNTRYDEATDTWFQDRRWVNVSEVTRKGIDMELQHSWSTDNNSFTITARRSLTKTYDFVLDPATDRHIDIVQDVTDELGKAAQLDPVPKTVDSIQLSWERSAWQTSVDINTRGKTSRTYGAATRGTTYEFTPPTTVDFTIVYDLDQASWLPLSESLVGSRIIFTVNNLTSAYGEQKIFNADGEELEPDSGSSFSPYGGVFNLTFNTSLGGKK